MREQGRLEADCMPDIIAGASSFIDAVDARCADGESFLAFPYAANATIDIILKLTLGESSEALRKRIQAILRKQEVYAASASRLMPSRDRLNPIRRLRERQLNRYVEERVQPCLMLTRSQGNGRSLPNNDTEASGSGIVVQG